MLAILTKKHLYLGISRYLLALSMLPYALSKILGTQFVLTGFTLTELQSIEGMPGSMLVWAFLGRSVWLQVFLGFAELVPSILLLFRKTILLGAMLIFPMTLNVFLINFALDLWPETKMISSGLLFLNILVLGFKWGKIKSMLKLMVFCKIQLKSIKIETAINVTIIAIVALFALMPVIEYRNQRNELTGDWVNQRPIEWILEREVTADSTLAYRDLKVYFGAYGNYDEVGASSNTSEISYKIDTKNRIITLKYDDGNIENCKYKILGDKELKIDRPNESNKSLLTQFFRKRTIYERDID